MAGRRRQRPEQNGHRAGVRSFWHARAAGNRAGARTSTGPPSAGAARAVRQAKLGSRAAAAAGSRACSRSSPTAVTRGAERAPSDDRRGSRAPSPTREQLGLGGACEAAEQEAVPASADRCTKHVAGVRIGRAGLGVQVVPSSQITRSPGSASGAKAAERVPRTARTSPRRTASQLR
jgi:hypothetical protein